MKRTRLIEIYYSIGFILVLSNAIRDILKIDLGSYENAVRFSTSLSGLIFLVVAYVLYAKGKKTTE